MFFGIPHILDSVELTKLSLGLLGSHMAAFSSGVNSWAWLILKDATPVTTVIIPVTVTTIVNILVIIHMFLAIAVKFTYYRCINQDI